MIDEITLSEPSSSQKDYRIDVKVRNNWLLKKIEAAGFDSVNQFCKVNKFNASRVGKFANLTLPPINSSGKWDSLVVRMATVLRCMPEDLFPPQHLKTALKKNKASFEAGIEEVAGFLTGSQEDAKPALERVLSDEAIETISESLKLLTPREERVIRLRYGLTPDGEEKTLADVGKLFGVFKERIRQIEAKAFRKMRRRGGNQKRLLEAAAQLGAGPQKHGPAVDRKYVPEWKREEMK